MRPIFILLSLMTFFLRGFENFSQDLNYGKYEPFEVSLSTVSFEPEAEAVVIQEKCINLFFGAALHSTIHRRIKILKESGKKNGDITIRYFKGEDEIQKISKLKAQTVNFENGKESITKLSKNDFFEVDEGNGWMEVRFTFPNLQIGSIIEYEYQLIDKGILFLEGWVFQNQVPTLKSIYSIDIPEYLDYKLLSQGVNTAAYDFKTNRKGVYRWEINELRSIKEEPHMNYVADYLEKVAFQLDGYSYRNNHVFGESFSDYKKMFETWQDLADFFIDHKPTDTFFDENYEDVLTIHFDPENNDPILKARAIYDFICENFSFNGESGIIPTQPFSETAFQKRGNRAEINLALIRHLKANGIKAHPLMISSKGNGRSTLVAFPFADQFNHLIAVAEIGEKFIFMDATNPDIPMGYLPLDFHVGQGFILMKENSGLIDVQLPHKSGMHQFTNISFKDNKNLLRETSLKLINYDHFVKPPISRIEPSDLEKKQPDFLLDDQEKILFINHSLDQKGIDKMTITLHTIKEIKNGGDVYIIPFLLNRWKSNPFTATTRTFPVDFNYSFTDRLSAKIEMPQGYILDDFPEEISVSLPDGSITFSYMVSLIGNIVAVNAVLSVKNHIIAASDYAALKYLIEIISSKLTSPIIIQKNENFSPNMPDTSIAP